MLIATCRHKPISIAKHDYSWKKYVKGDVLGWVKVFGVKQYTVCGGMGQIMNLQLFQLRYRKRKNNFDSSSRWIKNESLSKWGRNPNSPGSNGLPYPVVDCGLQITYA